MGGFFVHIAHTHMMGVSEGIQEIGPTPQTVP